MRRPFYISPFSLFSEEKTEGLLEAREELDKYVAQAGKLRQEVSPFMLRRKRPVVQCVRGSQRMGEAKPIYQKAPRGDIGRTEKRKRAFYARNKSKHGRTIYIHFSLSFPSIEP